MARTGLIVSSIFTIACMMLSGCASSQPTRFYVLNALEASGNDPAGNCPAGAALTLGIQPVGVPRYLERPQIMTKAGENEFRLSELNVWAEPLGDNITRVMAHSMGRVPCIQVAAIPKPQSPAISHRLSIEVVRLEGTLGGQALLDVRWSVTDEMSKQVLFTRTSTYRESVGSNDYSGLVRAYNRLLDAFSREASDAIGSLRPEKKDP